MINMLYYIMMPLLMFFTCSNSNINKRTIIYYQLNPIECEGVLPTINTVYERTSQLLPDYQHVLLIPQIREIEKKNFEQTIGPLVRENRLTLMYSNEILGSLKEKTSNKSLFSHMYIVIGDSVAFHSSFKNPRIVLELNEFASSLTSN